MNVKESDEPRTRWREQSTDVCNKIFFCARQPPVGQGLLYKQVSRSLTTTHYSRYDFCGRVISSSHSPAPDNTINKNQNRRTSTPPVGFEPTVSAGERPQNYALDRAATGTGSKMRYRDKVLCNRKCKL